MKSGDEAAIDYGTLDMRIGYILRRAQVAVFQDFYRSVSAYDISPAQYSVLTIVECNPGLTQTQVADALGIKKTNFVAVIRELESRGLIERQPIRHDKRVRALHLTASGVTLIAALHTASADHEERIIAAVGQKTYAALCSPLRLISHMGEFAKTTDAATKQGS